MYDNPIFLGFCAFILDFFKIQWCFVDCRVKFYIKEVLFLGRVVFGFEKSYFLVFFEFSKACSSYIYLYD